MRIAYLISQYPYIRHTYILREVQQLRQLGWDLSTLAIRRDDRREEDMTADERAEAASTHYVLDHGLAGLLLALVRTLFRHPVGYLKGIFSALCYGQCHPVKTVHALLYFAQAASAGLWLEDNQISHLHTHYASTVVWLLARIFPIETSMTIHGSAEFDDIAGFRLREKILTSKFVVAISYFGRSQMMRAVPYAQWKKIHMCALGVNTISIQPRLPRADGVPFELLCVGGMALPRAFQILLESIAIVAKSGLPVLLRLVGDGPERTSLEKLCVKLQISDHVVFEGWKNQDELPALYDQADAFVLSSFAEGIPVVLMEAMARGVPCIAPSLGGIPELIHDGVDGLLFAPSNERELAGAIGRLIQNSDLQRDLGEAARHKIEDRFNSDKNVAALADVFSYYAVRSPQLVLSGTRLQPIAHH